jgi:hypothetical protein
MSSVERLADVLGSLKDAIAEQTENVARCQKEQFEQQQGKLFGLEWGYDIAYRIMMEIGEDE